MSELEEAEQVDYDDGDIEETEDELDSDIYEEPMLVTFNQN